jgi:integrase
MHGRFAQAGTITHESHDSSWREAECRCDLVQAGYHSIRACLRQQFGLAWLVRIADDQAAVKAAAGDVWAHSGLVFPTRVGTPFEPRNLNRRFETRCAKAGVRPITVHDMRHTCATLLAALDVHPRVAMRILRHAQIDVTMNVYTEVSDAKTLQALKRLGRQLGS